MLLSSGSHLLSLTPRLARLREKSKMKLWKEYLERKCSANHDTLDR